MKTKRSIGFWITLIAFAAFGGRLAAEYLIGWSPIGYDASVAYPEVLLLEWSGLGKVWAFDLLELIQRATSFMLDGSILWSIKLVAALLQGLLTFSIGVWLWKRLSISPTYLLPVLIALQMFVPYLRLSQDLQRNVLGLCLLLLIDTVWSMRSRYRFGIVLLLSVALLRTHEAVTYFALLYLIAQGLARWVARLQLRAWRAAAWVAVVSAYLLVASSISGGRFVLLEPIRSFSEQFALSLQIAWLLLGFAFIAFIIIGFRTAHKSVQLWLIITGFHALIGIFAYPDRWILMATPALIAVAIAAAQQITKALGEHRQRWVVAGLVLSIAIPGIPYVTPSLGISRRLDMSPNVFSIVPPAVWASGLIANADEWREVQRIPACLDWALGAEGTFVVTSPTYFSAVQALVAPDLRHRILLERDRKTGMYGIGRRLELAPGQYVVPENQPAGCRVIQYN